MNGELAYEVDIAEAFGARVERACEPRWLIFLERTQEKRSRIHADVVGGGAKLSQFQRRDDYLHNCTKQLRCGNKRSKV